MTLDVRSLLTEGVEKGAFRHASVAVFRSGQLVLCDGTHDKDDVYDVASVTKVATAALALRHFDPEARLSMAGTVRDLLSHHTGLPAWRPFHAAAAGILGVTVSEFGLYWAHHIAHKWRPLWRFHAVHHSVKKLYVINTGRFHFVDSLKSIIPGMAILLALGAPMEVVTWLSAITAYIGILTHCNVEMRFGWLSVFFNTPELHRWHHSKDLREGDKNFGENIMLWDWVFGTWFNESWRRPPVDIGIKDDMPARFRDQLVWPFRFYMDSPEYKARQAAAGK